MIFLANQFPMANVQRVKSADGGENKVLSMHAKNKVCAAAVYCPD